MCYYPLVVSSMKNGLAPIKASPSTCARPGCSRPCHKPGVHALSYAYCSRRCGQSATSLSCQFAFAPVFEHDVDFHQVCAQLSKENKSLEQGVAVVFRILVPRDVLQTYTAYMGGYGGKPHRFIYYFDQQCQVQPFQEAPTKHGFNAVMKAIPRQCPITTVPLKHALPGWRLALVCTMTGANATSRMPMAVSQAKMSFLCGSSSTLS
ncbi:hypothetical protein SYNPS1DRAFT_30345 [Syncephalis pseudoplumigaleata]|uniref:Uncharacterized protein n=1 Tax=Syncephalis pseudoplumigaleata TaxID=1712513 RepID=A0A4P9YV21_9FUNG|nr:hypothetical protein SYNPS1DRAFT_30345 [Syncephalis pseudoplumigaleata]|eukprot:RKP23893.1 hypothetical protein SYNPS1DRAFT_30345 [Syncephalis pseudoplumigaleata]